jgi:opacity protein-like surface antigen
VYLRGDVGIDVEKRVKFHNRDLVNAPDGQWVDTSIDTAPFVGVGVGYRFNNWLRTDVTAEFRGSENFDAKAQYTFCDDFFQPCQKVARNDLITGSLTSKVVLANAYFANFLDCCRMRGLVPFVGAGIGFAHHRVHGLTDIDNTPGYNATGFSGEFTKTTLAWAVHAGLGYQVSPNLTLEIAYRYLNMGDATSDQLSSLPLPAQFSASPVELKDVAAHEVKLGMRWQFGGCCGPTF